MATRALQLLLDPRLHCYGIFRFARWRYYCDGPQERGFSSGLLFAGLLRYIDAVCGGHKMCVVGFLHKRDHLSVTVEYKA